MDATPSTGGGDVAFEGAAPAESGSPGVAAPQGGIPAAPVEDATAAPATPANTDAESEDADEMAKLLLAMPAIDISAETRTSRSALKMALLRIPGMQAVIEEKPWLLERLVQSQFDNLVAQRALDGEGTPTPEQLAELDDVTGLVLDQLLTAWTGELEDDIARARVKVDALKFDGADANAVSAAEADLATLVDKQATSQDALVNEIYLAHVELTDPSVAGSFAKGSGGEYVVTGNRFTPHSVYGRQDDVVFSENYLQDLAAWGHETNVLSAPITQDFEDASNHVTNEDGTLDVEAFAVAVSMRMPGQQIGDQTLARAIAWVSAGDASDISRRAKLVLTALHTAAHARIPFDMQNRPADLADIEASGEQLALTLMPQFDYENGTPSSENPTNDPGRELARANIEKALTEEIHDNVRLYIDDSVLTHATAAEKATLLVKLMNGTTKRNDEGVIETILASIKSPEEMTTVLRAAGPAQVWGELETHQRSFVSGLQQQGAGGQSILNAMVAAIGRPAMSPAMVGPSPADARNMIAKAMSKKVTSDDIDDFVSKYMTLDVLAHATPAEKAHMLLGLMDGNTGESDERAMARILESVSTPGELAQLLTATGDPAEVWSEVEGEQAKLLTRLRARGETGEAIIAKFIELTNAKTVLGEIPMIGGAIERTLQHGVRQGVLDNPLVVDIMAPNDTPQKNIRRDANEAADEVLAFTRGQVPVSTAAAAAALKLRFPDLDAQEMWGAIAFVNRAENSYEATQRMADVILAFQVRNKVGIPPRSADHREEDFIEVAPEVAKWRDHLSEGDWNNLVKRMGVPGTHHFRLDSKRQLFISFDEHGQIADVDTDKIGTVDRFMNRYGGIVTVLSLIPSPIQPFVAAANAAYSAYKAYEAGDILGAVVGAVGAVAGFGKATKFFSEGVQASLNAVAGSLAGIATVNTAINEKDFLKLLSGIGAIAGATGDQNLQETLDAIVTAGTAIGNKDYLALVEVVLENVDGISDEDVLKKLAQFKSLMKLEEAIGDSDLHAALVALEGSGVLPGSFPHFEAQSVAVALEAIESGDPAKIATALMLAAASYKHDPEKREQFLEAAAAANDGNYGPLLTLFGRSDVVAMSPEFKKRVEQLGGITAMFNAARAGDAEALEQLLEGQAWMEGHDAGKWADHAVIVAKLAEGDTAGALHMIADRFEENEDAAWATRFKKSALSVDVVNAVRSGDQAALEAALVAYKDVAGDTDLPNVIAALDAARRGDVSGALNLLATAAGVDDRGSARDLRRASIWFDIGAAAKDGDMKTVEALLKEHKVILGEDNVDVTRLIIAAASGDPVAFLEQLAKTGTISGDFADEFSQAASLAKMAQAIEAGDIVGTIDAFREHQEKVGHALPVAQAEALSAAVKAHDEGQNADALFAASTFLNLVGLEPQGKELTKIGNIVAFAEAVEGGDKKKIEAALIAVVKDRLDGKRVDAMVEKYKAGDKKGALLELSAALDEKGYGSLALLIQTAAQNIDRDPSANPLLPSTLAPGEAATAQKKAARDFALDVASWDPNLRNDALVEIAAEADLEIETSIFSQTENNAERAIAQMNRGEVPMYGEEALVDEATLESLKGLDPKDRAIEIDALVWERALTNAVGGKDNLDKLVRVYAITDAAPPSELERRNAAGEWLSTLSFREQQLVTGRLLHQMGDGGEIPQWNRTTAARDASSAMTAINSGDPVIVGGETLSRDEVDGIVARAEAVGGGDALFETLLAVGWEKEFSRLNGEGALNQIDAIVENLDDAERAQLKDQAADIGKVPMDKIGALQNGLDIVGLIPGVGDVADALNIGLALAIGDFMGAALSALSMVPFVGDAIAKPIKFALQNADVKAAREALKLIESNRDKLGWFADSYLMQNIIGRLESIELGAFARSILKDGSGPKDVLEVVTDFKKSNPSAADSEELFTQVDAYLRENVARVKNEIAELERLRGPSGQFPDQHGFQVEKLNQQAKDLAEISKQRGRPLNEFSPDEDIIPSKRDIPVAVPRFEIDLDNKFNEGDFSRAEKLGLESENTPAGWLKGDKGEGDFGTKGAHVHVTGGNPKDKIDIEVSFKGVTDKDGNLDIEFGIVNTTSGNKASDQVRNAARAAVAKRLQEDSTFRAAIIKGLRDALAQAGSRTGQLEGAELLLKLLEQMG